MDNKSIHIIGGGTVCHLASHLATCVPAYGGTARRLYNICTDHVHSKSCFDKLDVQLHLTKMANSGKGDLETNNDIERLIDKLIADDRTRIIVLNAALVDFGLEEGRKKYKRYSTHGMASISLTLDALPKIVTKIRKTRKDIFLVAFKQTCGLSEQEQYIAGLDLCKRASCNLVLANDDESRLNMVITPEEAKYHVTKYRMDALVGLMEMTKARSHLMFTRSTVIAGDPIQWDSELVYPSLRTVVDHCIKRGAYKPFNGSTAGHFACKLNETTFLTSIRKTDFNDLPKNGLVKVVTDGPDAVTAYGAKPSVGGQSQRIVFHDHTDYDCILHFHCPINPGSNVPTVSQREIECGSHECGKNTSNGLKKFGNLSAVYLDQHGPNIVFHHSINPQEVIDFIEDNFDLLDKTGGFVSTTKGDNHE
jgi:hypothetical protein